MRFRAMVLAALLLVAVAVTVARVPLAAAPATDLVAAHVAGPLPIKDPASPLWQSAVAIDAPMSGQVVAVPRAPTPSVEAVSVRALTDGQWVAIRIDWKDATKNDGLGHDAFKDGAAVQFPSKGGQPFICMGVGGDSVNILHWRSDFQADIERGAGPTTLGANPGAVGTLYPLAGVAGFRPATDVGNPVARATKTTPVESLAAEGFGTLAATATGEGDGWAVWRDGVWSAVIARPLSTTAVDDLDLAPGATVAVAFAVWDGARGGKKTVSSWVTLEIGTPGAPAPAPARPAAPVQGAPVPSAAPVAESNVGAYIAIAVLAGVATSIAGVTVLYGLRRRARA
ncbi:MAG: hypothetical protein FJ029_00915 [Actinobacteria bacterium]|nr:hypothetical protein [Actinomycetota bacterium]